MQFISCKNETKLFLSDWTAFYEKCCVDFILELRFSLQFLTSCLGQFTASIKILYPTFPFSDKGEVFGLGNSEYGQFQTVTEEQQINCPVKLNLEGIGKIIDIASGGTICMVLNGIAIIL